MPEETRRCVTCGSPFTYQYRGSGQHRKYCPEHSRAGRYGGEHRRLRAELLARAVGMPCARCGQPFTQAELNVPGKIHLDHSDVGGDGDYRGLSHARCNIAAGFGKAVDQKGAWAVAQAVERARARADARADAGVKPPEPIKRSRVWH
jgi:hypothetical protein